MRLTNIYYVEIQDKQKRDTLFTLYDEMDAEAEKHGNNNLRATIRINRLNIFNTTQQFDEVIKLAPNYLKLIEKKQLWNMYYQLYNPLIIAYRNKNENEKALEIAKEMYEHAKARQHNSGIGMAFYNMATIYKRQRRFSEQEKCLRESITLMQDSISVINILANVHSQLGFCLVAQRRYDEAIRTAGESEKIIRRYEAVSQAPQPNSWLLLYQLYLSAYRQAGLFDEAEIYCHKIDSLTNGTFELYEEWAAIFCGRGQYEKALEMADKAIEVAKPEGKIQAMGEKMMILLKKCDPEATEKLFIEIIGALDARNNERMNAQLDEIRTQYEVDKINAEKERIRNYLLFALGGCLLLALLLGVFIYYSRLVRNKNRGLYLQIKEQDRLTEELRRAMVETEHIETEQSPSPKHTETGNVQQRQLVARFREHLLNERIYTNSEINLDKLISALATNRTYLFEAVKAVTEKTPVEYIRSLQLEEAKQMLETRFELNIETIAEDCGFNSRSTFYRLFRERYQINPTEYRKMAREQL